MQFTNRPELIFIILDKSIPEEGDTNANSAQKYGRWFVVARVMTEALTLIRHSDGR